jgi:hypothetical protein
MQACLIVCSTRQAASNATKTWEGTGRSLATDVHAVLEGRTFVREQSRPQRPGSQWHQPDLHTPASEQLL